MFDELKTAQAAAYLVAKEGGKMSHLKLMKLLYLADRESYKTFNTPITGDSYCSMPYGPVLSTTLNLINGVVRFDNVWNKWITDRDNHQVGSDYNLKNDPDLDELDELSRNDINILTAIYERFGGYDQWRLVDYTHNPSNIPEWKDPHGSSAPIHLDTLLTYLGKDRSTIQSITNEHDLRLEFNDIIQRNQ